eukprot:6464380-Amphidinium_carterae.1
MFIEQNEVMLSIPLDRLLAWAYRVQKQTQYVVVAPSAVTFEQGMQTEFGVFEPATPLVDQSLDFESIQLKVCESDKFMREPWKYDLEYSSEQFVLARSAGCDHGVQTETWELEESIVDESVATNFADHAEQYDVCESKLALVDSCCASSLPSVADDRSRPHRRHRRRSGWTSWPNVLSLVLAVQSVSVFMNTPVSHLAAQTVSDLLDFVPDLMPPTLTSTTLPTVFSTSQLSPLSLRSELVLWSMPTSSSSTSRCTSGDIDVALRSSWSPALCTSVPSISHLTTSRSLASSLSSCSSGPSILSLPSS